MNWLVLLCIVLIFSANAKVEKKRESNGNAEQVDGYQEQAVQSCPALHFKRGVTAHPPSCTDGPRPSGTLCHFSCKPGYRIGGPPMTECHDDGSWLYGVRNIKCVDIDECKFRKGGCSHTCVNTDGGFHCECPSPLVLDKNGKNCRAVGLVLNCTDHNIQIIIPKYVLSDLQGDYLQLRDPTCHPRENKTHYIFNSELNGCGTTRRHTKNFIVYSNRITEKAVKQHGVITRVGEGEFNIPFCCYYLDNAIVSSVGYKPFVRELVLKEKGYGKFKLRMDFFRTKNYQSEYTWEDFPVSVYLRERLYFEVSIDSIDQNLVVFPENCYATPTRDHKKAGRFRHEIIHEGCIGDSTTKREPSFPHKQRFSIEAFKFVGNFTFVYMHCSVIVCKAGDPKSRCFKGCLPGLLHGKPMNGQYTKRKHVPKSQESFKTASKDQQKRAPIPVSHDTTKATNDHLQKKDKIRYNRSIRTQVHMRAKKEKPDHKYMLSKGPVSLLEDEPEIARAGSDEKAPDTNLSDDTEQAEEPLKEKEKTRNKEDKVASTTDVLLITLIAFTILALLGVLYIGRKVGQASNRGIYDYKPMKF